MKCPRCETVVLAERERDGILVDACQSCRGVWLDRGELEKLIARATRELDELDLRGARAVNHERDHDDDYYRRHHKRKRRWFEALDDIFD